MLVSLVFECSSKLTYIHITDVGASSLIANGKIQLKTGGEIQCFTEKGLMFSDGIELEADVVVFATGYVCIRE